MAPLLFNHLGRDPISHRAQQAALCSLADRLKSPSPIKKAIQWMALPSEPYCVITAAKALDEGTIHFTPIS